VSQSTRVMSKHEENMFMQVLYTKYCYLNWATQM